MRLLPFLMSLLAQSPSDDAARAETFERRIRPIFAAHCVSCHGPAKQKGGLRLDRRAPALAGGESGPAIVPKRVDEGELLKAVRYDPDGYRMPPTGKLPPETVAELERWIKEGADWPDDAALSNPPAASKEDWLKARKNAHWCWRPIRPSPVPVVKDQTWASSDVDRFLQSPMEGADVRPTADADRYTLLRRVHFLLTGLPPTPEEVETFVADDHPLAYERVVDKLLASPSFGERWARHWLDLVRYSETLGHEFDFDIPNAWQYRDYVVRALNADLPYDRFLVEHVAGDLLPDPRLSGDGKMNESIIAPACWWLGEAKQAPVDVKAEQADHVDNQIDVLGKAFLGLTVSCARCHDHKFDAVSTQDYYALYGFLKSTRYTQASTTPASRWREEIAARSRLEQEIRAIVADDWKNRIRSNERLFDESEAVVILRALEGTAPRSLLASGDSKMVGSIDDGFVGWRRSGPASMLAETQIGDPVLDDSPKRPIRRLHVHAAFDSSRWDRRFQGTFRSPTFVIDRPFLHVSAAGEGARFNVVVEGFNVIRAPIYGGLKIKLDGGSVKWSRVDLAAWVGREAYVEFLDQTVADLGDPDRSAYPPDAWFSVQHVLLSNDSQPPRENKPDVQKRKRVAAGTGFDGAEAAYSASDDVRRLAMDAVTRWRSGEPTTPEDVAMMNALIDRKLFGDVSEASVKRTAKLLEERRRRGERLPDYAATPTAEDGDGRDEAVFIRGNPKKTGPVAPRRFLEAIDGDEPASHQPGSGRLWLARRLTDPSNPLVARVVVNRVWRHVFGRGLVESPDNFGVLGEAPSHPELLDHLASRFVKEGWSIKRLIRRLATSRAFRLASAASPDDVAKDPSNKLSARASVRRLEAESLRDALTFASGSYNRRMFGPGVSVHLDAFAEGRGRPKSGPLDGDDRRAVYLAVRRNFPSSMLVAFDAPAPAGPVGKRSASNVPAQALIMLNDPFVVHRARALARRLLADPATEDARIRRLYLICYSRPAVEKEVVAARRFLGEQATLRGRAGDSTEHVWTDLCHALFNSKEFLFLR
jgi:cytochrome c553